MSYRPAYCSNCGDKIERIEWFAWTSRNFCQVCEKEHKVFDKLPIILSVIIGVFGVFTFGSYLWADNNQASAVSENQPRIKMLKQNNPPKNERAVSNQAQNLTAAGNANDQIVVQNDVPVPKPEVQTPAVRQIENVPVVAAKEPVYFCGAQTKKGTPCSRKMKGGGRCWQHEGQAAMFPPEKLLISR